MKKSKFYWIASTLALVLLCLFAPQAQAYPDGVTKDTSKSNIRIQRTNWENSMGCTFSDIECVALGEDNALVLKLIVQMAVDDITDYPALHFRYIFFDTKPFAIDGMTAAVTNDMLVPVLLDSGDEGWQASFIFDFSFAEQCTNLEHFDFRIQYQLMTETTNGDFIPYPVAAVPTLFPPGIFYIDPNGFSDVVEVKKEICCFDDTYDCTPNSIDPYKTFVANTGSAQQEEQNRNTNDSNASQTALKAVKSNAIESQAKHNSVANLHVFPNPFSAAIQVLHQTPEDAKEYKMRVFNALGNEVFTKEEKELTHGNHSTTISTENWPAGVYYLYYFSGKEKGIEKIIKQ